MSSSSSSSSTSSSISGSNSSGVSSSSGSSESAPSIKHGIKLKKFVQTSYVINNIDGFRMKIETLSANNMNSAIFRYIKGPFNGNSGNYQEDFDGVCSPSDLEEFPIDAPAAGANPAWFRKDYVDLVFRSQTTAEETWDKIVSDVTILIKTLDVMDNISQEKIVSIGDPAN